MLNILWNIKRFYLRNNFLYRYVRLSYIYIFWQINKKSGSENSNHSKLKSLTLSTLLLLKKNKHGKIITSLCFHTNGKFVILKWFVNKEVKMFFVFVLLLLSFFYLKRNGNRKMNFRQISDYNSFKTHFIKGVLYLL